MLARFAATTGVVPAGMGLAGLATYGCDVLLVGVTAAAAAGAPLQGIGVDARQHDVEPRYPPLQYREVAQSLCRPDVPWR